MTASDQVRLIPHWSKFDLQSVKTSYDSLAAHNSAFFLLIVEECIESPSFRGDSFESVRLNVIKNDEHVICDIFDRSSAYLELLP
jgi:hypothetical protein